MTKITGPPAGMRRPSPRVERGKPRLGWTGLSRIGAPRLELRTLVPQIVLFGRPTDPSGSRGGRRTLTVPAWLSRATVRTVVPRSRIGGESWVLTTDRPCLWVIAAPLARGRPARGRTGDRSRDDGDAGLRPHRLERYASLECAHQAEDGCALLHEGAGGRALPASGGEGGRRRAAGRTQLNRVPGLGREGSRRRAAGRTQLDRVPGLGREGGRRRAAGRAQLNAFLGSAAKAADAELLDGLTRPSSSGETAWQSEEPSTSPSTRSRRSSPSQACWS